jgi:hypothetical protein
MEHFGNTVKFHLEECFCFSRFIKHFANKPSMHESIDESPNFTNIPPEILYQRHLLRMNSYSTINMHGQFIIFALQCPSNSCMALHV